MAGMFDKLESVEQRFLELESQLAEPSLADQPGEFRRLSREHASLLELIDEYRRYKGLQSELSSNRELLEDRDPELSAMAREELKRLEPELEQSKRRLQVLLLPKDPNDDKNVVIEIRAGTGGDEATLFASEVFRMYLRYAERHRYGAEVMSLNETGIGGVKEAIVDIAGDGAYSNPHSPGSRARSPASAHFSTCDRRQWNVDLIESSIEADRYVVGVNRNQVSTDALAPAHNTYARSR